MNGMTCFRLPALLLCAALAGCGYFIPPDQSVPRYNSVIGEPRRPELNPASGAAPVDHSSSAAPTASMPSAYPPVSDETRARADAVTANDIPPPVVATTPATQPLARHVPEENATASAASDYPVLNTVPPSPAVEDQAAAARLARVRAELEQERAQAGSDKTQLAHDAAAEPSLANPGAATAAVVPPPEPVAVAPIAPPIGVVTTTAPSYISSALPPPPSPLMPSVSNASTPMSLGTIPSVTPMPVQNSVTYTPPQEPIILHAPPASIAPSASAPAYAGSFSSPSYNVPNMVSAQPMPAPAAGGFNPMADAGSMDSGSSSIYPGSTGYLPPSRYAQQRGY